MPDISSRLRLPQIEALLLTALCGACSADLQVGRARETRPPELAEMGNPVAAMQDLPAPGLSVMRASNVDASTLPANATSDPSPTPVSIDETGANNPAGLSPAEVGELIGGGPLGDMKWLYPYDGTVFPRGTLAPLVMWHSDAAPDAVYFQMQSRTFAYKGVLVPTADGGLVIGDQIANPWGNANANAGEAKTQLAIPPDVWARAGQQSLGKRDPFTLEITQRVNGQIRGPIRTQITIAQADVKGSVYYNTCWSGTIGANASAGGLTSAFGFVGSVHRIPPGGKAELVLHMDKCHGCHSVSANGTRLLVQQTPTQDQLAIGVVAQDPNANKGQAMVLELGVDGRSTSMAAAVPGNGSFGALYPDGSKYLSTAVRAVSQGAASDPSISAFGVGGIRQWGGLVDFSKFYDGFPAVLWDIASAQPVADSGIPESALMPMFSPDGTWLVFNDLSIYDARALAVMRYDVRADRASDYRVLLQNPSTGPLRPGWPFFLPDNRAVVFVQSRTDSFSSDSFATSTGATACANMAGMCGSDGGTMNTQSELSTGKPSDLYIADMTTGTVTLLSRAMGFDSPAAADTDTYLAFGSQDLHHNYFPTVSPVAAGGYFWVFFDTLRHFGSLGLQRAIWGFAIDIQADGNYALDPSHPPFYLSGQEFATSSSNHRAFAALDRCRPDSSPCATGIDCCNGHCADATCAPPPVDRCAARDERCTIPADCCNANDACINGFCAYVDLK